MRLTHAVVALVGLSVGLAMSCAIAVSECSPETCSGCCDGSGGGASGTGGSGSGGAGGMGGASGTGGTSGTGGASGTGGTSGTGGASGTGADAGSCDGSVLNGSWIRSDMLVITFAATGCSIVGSANTAAFRHTLTGTYNDASRVMPLIVQRTSVATGCVTSMTGTLILTDSTHLTLVVTGTDGACDLPAGYNEATVYTKQ